MAPLTLPRVPKLDTTQDYRPSHSPHDRAGLGLAVGRATGLNLDINRSYQPAPPKRVAVRRNAPILLANSKESKIRYASRFF